MKFCLIALLITTVLPVAAASDTFDSHWRDGKAEIDGYRLTIDRYGQERDGTAVMIFVTEPFRQSTRVKADHPVHHPDDIDEVLKLNFVRDFQTGIYDYNTMVSVFSRSSDFAISKISFSSAEWCGHIYEERIFREDRVSGDLSSYFEGESGEYELPRPAGGVAEDNLFVLLRGLRGEFLAPGASRQVPFLPSPFVNRLFHTETAWTSAIIRRQPDTVEVEVPAGTFTTSVYELQVEDGRSGRFHIEAAYPHRIVRWELRPDVRGELTGTLRVPYWQLNGNGNESFLERLGLE